MKLEELSVASCIILTTMIGIIFGQELTKHADVMHVRFQYQFMSALT